MQKKQVRILLTGLQVLLLAMQFLPAGRVASEAGNEQAVSVFGMISLYAGAGFVKDAKAYLVISVAAPILIIFLLFVLRERLNFGAAACLSAFYLLSAACFFSAASRKMVNSFTTTDLHYLVVLASAISVVLACWGFCLCSPPSEKEG